MIPQTIDCYVLDADQRNNFFSLTQMRYRVSAEELEEGWRAISTFTPKGLIHQGVLYKNPAGSTTRIIPLPGSNLERFMERNFKTK